MRDMSDVPLTDAEKLMYGEDARRMPSGAIEERGVGSAFQPKPNIFLGKTDDKLREIDLRGVHPFPDRVQ